MTLKMKVKDQWRGQRRIMEFTNPHSEIILEKMMVNDR